MCCQACRTHPVLSRTCRMIAIGKFYKPSYTKGGLFNVRLRELVHKCVSSRAPLVIHHCRTMNTALAIALLFIAHATMGYCGDEEYNQRQYDNPYMWMMMMNAGPQTTAFNPWMLLFLGIGTILLSRDLMVVPSIDKPEAISLLKSQ